MKVVRLDAVDIACATLQCQRLTDAFGVVATRRGFDVRVWKIGYKDDLGSSLAGIQSTDDLGGPQDVKTWKYYTGVKWITSDDILVDTLVEPGT